MRSFVPKLKNSAVFAISSVLLAAVGLYGTLAYLVAQRTREFGIRLALGSTMRGIVVMVVREGALFSVDVKVHYGNLS